MNKRWKRISFCLIAILFVGICVAKMKFDAYATDISVVGDANDDTTFNIKDLTRVKKYTVSTDVVDINATNADLNNDEEITLKDLEHCREFLVKGYSVVTGTYAYNSGTYEDGILTNVGDAVAVKMGDINANVNMDTQTFEAVVANGTHDVALTSSYFRDVTVSSVEVNEATNVETAFTVPKMTPTGNCSYSESSGSYAVYNGVAIKPVNMTAEEGFTATITMRPYSAGRYRGNIGVSVDGNTFYIIPYRDKDTGEVYIYVSESIINEWDYTSTGIAATRVGGTGKTLASTDVANKCTLNLTYLNGNYYVSVQIPGDDTVSKTLLLNAQSTGLDAKYFAAGTREVKLCGFKTMMAYYTDISYQIGDDAAKAELASVQEYAIPTLNITEYSADVNTGIVANEGFVMTYNVTRYSSNDTWTPAGVYFAYSDSEKNFFAIGDSTHAMKSIAAKKMGNSLSYTSLPDEDYVTGDLVTIVYLNNAYYIILDGQTKVIDSTGSFSANYGLGANLFTTHPRTIGFATSSKTTAQFSNVNISLGDTAAEEVLCNVGYAARVTGSYTYNSGTYENGILTNKDDVVTVKIGDTVANINQDAQTFEAVVPKGTYDVTLTSNSFRTVTVSSVEVNEATNVETAFTVPKMTPTGNCSYSESSGSYAVYNGVAIKPVNMTAEGGFTATATMRPYQNCRYRGNIGVSVDGNTFYIIPYRDKDTGEVYIYVSESIINEWDYTSTGIAATRVGGTGKTLASADVANKCTLNLTYLNGNYYVSVQIPGDDIVSKTLLLNAQSTGLDAKYFAAGTREVKLCGFKTMMAYYTDISYQIGDDAAKTELASVQEYAIQTLNITANNADVNTGIVANEGFVMSYKVTRYNSNNTWDPAGVYFAYSDSEKNFLAIGDSTHAMKSIAAKKIGNGLGYTSLPDEDYVTGDLVTIVYLNNKYYVILDGQTKVLDSKSVFSYNYNLGANFFTPHPRTIGFATSSATTAQFSSVNIRLGDSVAQETLTAAGVEY